MALCHITGTVQLPDGTNAAGRILVFKRNPETVVAQSGHGIVPDEIAVKVAADGTVDFKLYTGNYIGFLRNQRQGNERVFKFPVPEAATALFQDILQAVDPVEPLPSWLAEAFEARDDALEAELAAQEAADRAEVAAEQFDFASEQAAVIGEDETHSMNPALSDAHLMSRVYAPYISKLDSSATSSALQSAIDYALEAIPRNGADGQAYATRRIVLPAGVYNLEETLQAHKTISSASLPDLQSIEFVGEGIGSTIIRPANPNMRLFDVSGLQISIRGMLIIGDDAGTTEFIKLGREDADTPVFQSEFSNLKLSRVNKGFTVGQLFDSSFNDVCILGLRGENPVGVDVLPHYSDNSNFINFNRVHIEQAEDATLFRARSNMGVNQYHQNFNFNGCHLETRYYNTKCLDLQGVINSAAIDCVMTRNNSHSTMPYTDASPIISMDGCHNIVLVGGGVSHVGAPQSDTPKLVKLTGSTRNVSFKNHNFAPSLTKTYPSVNDLIDNQSEDAALTTVSLSDCGVQDFSHVPISNSVRVASKSNGNRQFELDVSDTGAVTDLTVKYFDDASGQAKASILRVSPSKISNVGAIAAGFQVDLINGGTSQYTMPNPSGTNGNGRGVYIIYANSPADSAVAIVYSNGASLTPMFVGTGAAVGNTDPVSAGKINIFLTTGKITVTNRLGDTRAIGISPFGFGLPV